MNSRTKLIICTAINVLLLIFVAIIVFILSDSRASYWGVGPSDDFYVISVQIDTWKKYLGLLVVIALIKTVKVLVEELGMPVLGFSIYNPDKKIITEFTKNELQFFANVMFASSALRSILLVVISVTRIDIAIWSVIVGEVTSLYTIRHLLGEKEFKRGDIGFDDLLDIELV